MKTIENFANGLALTKLNQDKLVATADKLSKKYNLLKGVDKKGIFFLTPSNSNFEDVCGLILNSGYSAELSISQGKETKIYIRPTQREMISGLISHFATENNCIYGCQEQEGYFLRFDPKKALKNGEYDEKVANIQEFIKDLGYSPKSAMSRQGEMTFYLKGQNQNNEEEQ
jgi:hypothetical protein